MDFPHRNSLIIYSVFTLLSVNALYFTYYCKQTIPNGDSWRYISNALIPYYESGFRLDILWDHQHPSPLKILLLIANSKLFTLSFTLEKIIGITLKIIIAFLLVSHARKTIGEKNCLIPIIIITLLLFSFSNQKQYTWSVMSLVFLSILPVVIYLFVFNELLKYKKLNKTEYLGWTTTVVLFLIIERDAAIIVFTASTIFLLIHAWIERRPINYIYILTLAVLSSAFCIYVFPMITGHRDETFYKLITSTGKFAVNPKKIMDTYAISLLSGFVKPKLLFENFGTTSVIICGYLTFIFQLILFYGYLKSNSFRKTTVPIMLVLIANISFIPTVLQRYGAWHTPWLTVPDRYLINYALGAVGMIWLYSISFKQSYIKNIFLLLILLAVVANETHYVLNSWRNADYTNMNRYRESQRLVAFANGNLPRNKTEIPSRFAIEKPVEFMKQNCLNVFRYSCRENSTR